MLAFFTGKEDDDDNDDGNDECEEEDNDNDKDDKEEDVAAAVKVRNELPPGEESFLASATAPAIVAAYVLPAAPAHRIMMVTGACTHARTHMYFKTISSQ